MKLLILTQYFPPEVGAPQNRLYELALRLQKKGIDITVLTAMPNYPAMEIQEAYRGKKYVYEEMEGLKVHRSRIFVSKNKSIIKRLLNYFSFVWTSYWTGRKKLGNFDYILCESPPLFLGMSARRLCRNKKAKLIFNVSDLWPESAEKLGLVTNRFLLGMAYRLEAKLYKSATLITGQTQGIVKDILRRFPDRNVYWLPNGVDPAYYNPDTEVADWRAQNGFANDDFLLLYAGIIGHAQGLEIILHAAEKLRDKKQVKFILLGEGPVKPELLQLKEKGKLENVFFFPAVGKKDMPAVVSAADAAVIPLRRLDLFKGAIPSKIFENLAMQKPLLLGVEGEAKELFIDEGKCGLAFEPENAGDLAAKTMTLFENRDAAKAMGINGRRYVIEKFSRDKIAEGFVEMLNSVAGNP
ncbi:MAG: glycoside hydrolase family protein [Bacteroidetes bacterium]|nr:MAG: glycoside hydrolase family protein [Bacteroidota bacterium]